MAFGSVKVDQIITSTQTVTVDDLQTGANGSVTNAMLAGSIADSKLNQITTAGKVSGSAVTSGTIGGSTGLGTTGNLATTGTLAIGQANAASNVDLDLAGTYAQTVVAVPASDIDCSLGNYFTKTISGNTTFTISNVPISRAYSLVLELTHTSGTVTWPSSVKFPGDSAPTLTDGKTSLFVLITDDGGTRFRAVTNVDYTT